LPKKVGSLKPLTAVDKIKWLDEVDSNTVKEEKSGEKALKLI
jgi:gluconate kinase